MQTFPILSVLSLTLALAAQDPAGAGKPAPDAQQRAEKHAAALLRIAEDLRRDGCADVADGVQAQVRVLLGQPPKNRVEPPAPDTRQGRDAEPVMKAPPGDPDYRSFDADDLPKASDARVDTGRRVIRYVPTQTGRDAHGNVTWEGLPEAPAGERPAPAANARLEQQVRDLSAAVRDLRAELAQLRKMLEEKGGR